MTGERSRDIPRGLVRSRDERVPQLPQAPVGRGGDETIRVAHLEGLEADAVPLERDRCERDHAAETPRRGRGADRLDYWDVMVTLMMSPVFGYVKASPPTCPMGSTGSCSEVPVLGAA